MQTLYGVLYTEKYRDGREEARMSEIAWKTPEEVARHAAQFIANEDTSFSRCAKIEIVPLVAGQPVKTFTVEDKPTQTTVFTRKLVEVPPPVNPDAPELATK